MQDGPDRRNSFDPAAARRRCLGYRRRILDLSQNVTAMHIAPAFSCLEMVDAIYEGLMRRDEAGRFRDAFVLSKGHGCLTQYVILEAHGTLAPAELDTYCTPASRLGGHPDHGVPGIEAATGSLGHGLGMALGMAYAERLKRTGGRIFAVLGDGELHEGSVWEAFMMAPNLGLDNLIAFADVNDFHGLGRISDSHPNLYPIETKLAAFGWEVAVVNGHDAEAVVEAVQGRRGGRPFFLVGRTVKGRGVSYMEQVPIWHYRSPNPDEYRRAVDELREVAS